jgi:hypothetical protein
MRATAEIDSSVVRRRSGIRAFPDAGRPFDAAMRGFLGLKHANV